MPEPDLNTIYLEIRDGLKNALSPRVFEFVWKSKQKQLNLLKREKPEWFKEVIEYKNKLKKDRWIK